jgi:seryl-tRNA synthetase
MQGINVPEPLRKYIPGMPEFIPYTRDLPKDSTSQKLKGRSGTKPSAIPSDVAKEMDNLKVQQ